jgi:hypothetical protein
MTRSQTKRVKDDATNNQDKMTSIAENASEDAPMTKKSAEKDDKFGEDGKRRRPITELAESPNRRSPKSPKSDDDAMEEDTVDLTKLEEQLEETSEQEVDIEWATCDDKFWTFTRWTEMTQHWKDIPKEIKNKASPFLLEDMSGSGKQSPHALVQALITRINPDFENLARQISEQFHHDMSTYTNRGKGFNQAKKAIELAIRFAITPPTELEKYFPEKQQLEQNDIGDTWIAANTLFGAIWNNPYADKEFVFNESEKLEPPKNLWKKMETEITAGAFSKDQIFGEGKDSAHDMCAYCEKEVFKGKTSTIQDWKNAFTKISIKPSKNLIEPERIMKTVLVRMARTNPRLFPGWIESRLQMNSLTKVWAAAYATVGGIWKKKEISWGQAPTPPIAKPPILKKTSEASKFSPTPEKETKKTSANPYFLSRSEPRSQKNFKNKKFSRKFTTHLKAKLCIWGTGTFPEGMTETISSAQSMFESIFERDAKAIILPWSNKTNCDPLSRTSKLPTSRIALEKYAENMFISKGRASWLRFKLGHDKPLEFYTESESLFNRLAEQDLDLFVDKIQTERTGCAGWFAGSIPIKTNEKDLEEALKQHPLLVREKITDLELRTQVTRVRGGKLGEDEPRVQALHVYTSYNDVPKLRKIMNLIYPSESAPAYPLGKQMRFAPNTADVRFPALRKTKEMADKLRSKQKRFLKDIITVSTSTIKNIHKVIDIAPHVSLMQVLMSWRSAEFPDRNLFISVDEYRDNVNFTYHKDTQEEASNIIPLLSLILEGKYGPRAWEWFHDEARDYTAGFIYDPVTGKIQSREEQDLAANVANWEYDFDEDDLVLDSNEPEFVIELGAIILDGPGPRKELDDRSVKTFRNASNTAGIDDPQLPDVTTDITEGTPSTMTPSTATDTESALRFLANDPNLPESLRAQLNDLDLTATPHKEDGGSG